MTWIYLLRLKYDVCVVIQYFLTFVQTQFHKTIKVCRTENSIEFVNEICSAKFKEQGIIHQIT